MVRESLLSNTSPPCDERMLREHVKHHAPEHLSVSFSNTTSTPHPAPLTQDERGKGQNRGEGLLFTKRSKRGNPRVPKGSQHTVRLQLALIALLICRNGGLIKEPLSVCGSQSVVSYQTRLSGSCDSGHSLQCVGPCSVLLLGHRGLAATLCAADRGWPFSVGVFCDLPPASTPLSSPSPALPPVLWDKKKKNEETGMRNVSRDVTLG